MLPTQTGKATDSLFRTIALLALLGLCLAGPAMRAEAYAWANARIDGGGFVDGIIFHPAEHNLLYARTDVGGIYRWDTPGARWIPLNHAVGGLNNEFMLLGVLSLALDPSNPDVIYLACGQYTWNYSWNPSAILRSSDRGTTWTKTDVTALFKIGGNEDGRSCGERLAVDPHRGSTLFYGSNNAGLWRSTDSGASWSRVSTFTPTSCTFVLFDGRGGAAGAATQMIYVGVNNTTGSGLWRSTDGGTTWTAVANQPAGGLPHHGALASNGLLYLAYSDALGPNGVTSGSVWKLDTASGAWTPITPPAGQGGFAGLSVSAQDPRRVVVSTLDRWSPRDVVYLSPDGGSTWSDLTTAATWDHAAAPWAAANTPHWLGDIEIDPFDPARILFTTGYGLYATDNAAAPGPTWRFSNRGLEESVPTGLVSGTSGAPLVSTIGDFDGFRHDDLATSPPAGRHRPSSGSNTGIALAAANPSVLVRTFNAGTRGARSTDGGSSWTAFGTAPHPAKNGGRIALSADGATIVWTQENAAPCRSTDSGATWAACGNAPSSTSATYAPYADPVNAAKFYLHDHVAGRIHLSTNSGATFAPAAAVPAGGELAVAPGTEGHLWLCARDSGFQRSTDSAATFTPVASVQEAYRLGFGRAAPGAGYPTLFLWAKIAGTVGLFRSTDQAATWTRIDDDAHRFGALDVITGDARVFGRVFLGTSGFGIVYGEVAVPGTPSGLPVGFATQDVGYSNPAGAAGGTLDSFILRGAGTDLGGTSDAFRFAWRRTSGDCSATARVDSLQASNLSAKAGVMMRDGTTASAPFAAAVQLPDNTVLFLWRSVAGGSAGSYGPVASIDQPNFLRLVRSGNSFTAAYSTDNMNWTQVGAPVSITMAAEIASGVCLTSRNPEVVAASRLGAISLQPEPVSITTPPTLPAGTFGDSYSLALATRGGFPGYTWVVDAGALPAGLTLSVDGKIDGVPSAAGPSTFTISVTDQDGHSAQAQFSLSIANLAYSSWRTQNFTTAELADPTISGTAADPDNDGIPNLLEWASATAPKQRGTAAPTTFTVFVDTGTGAEYAELTFHWRIAAVGAGYIVQSSTDLVNWVDEQPTAAWQTTTDANGCTETVRARVLKTSSCLFLRLLVTPQN